MDRASLFILEDHEPNTFEFDETLPPLPLPALSETLQRYYESLKPFGSPEELANSRKIIDEFEKGIGGKLHEQLKNRASRMKNWLNDFWDSYAYHLLRMPLIPYCNMAMPLNLYGDNVEETPEQMLKNLARIIYHTIEFWDLIYKGKLKPLSSNGGKIKYSSHFYKRFYSSTRVPGVEMDHIEKHFRWAAEGDTPTHGIILGKGRIFTFNTVHPDGTILLAQELLVLLQRIRSMLDYEPRGQCVPILTNDDRTTWANNRMHLLELSAHNKETVKLIESASVVVQFDEHEPKNIEEVSQQAITGDFHSKWSDRTSIVNAYKNGKFSCIGEHSAYDGTISVNYALFVQLSMMELPEPDWSNTENSSLVELKELHFDLDNELRAEIERMFIVCEKMRTDVIVTSTFYDGFGKDYIKKFKFHPDSFVQVILQLAYTRLHNEIAPTYETALMRQFYNGRTETLRSCTNEVAKFLKLATDPSTTKEALAQSFRSAVLDHYNLMNEARKGNGIDRHLFGLWCIAYENKIDTPEFFSDELYAKSGGGGNFVLSTSTLGFTRNTGFVAPMVLDGYGVFYSITTNIISFTTTVYRDSTKTSAYKFNEMFKDTFKMIGELLDSIQDSKL